MQIAKIIEDIKQIAKLHFYLILDFKICMCNSTCKLDYTCKKMQTD